MLPSQNIQSIIGATVFGPDREKLGRVDQVFVDAVDGHPTWAEVNLGGIGHHVRYVPLQDATWERDDIHVPYDKDLLKHAPKIDGSGGLSPEQEQELERHYAGATDPDDERDDDGLEDDRDDDDDDGHGDDDRDDEGRATDSGTTRDTSDAGDGIVDGGPGSYIDDDGVVWEERTVVTTETVPVARVRVETLTDAEADAALSDGHHENAGRDEPLRRDRRRGQGDRSVDGEGDTRGPASP